WGPTAALANKILYTENSTVSGIYLMTEGGKHPGQLLTEFATINYQVLLDLHWLPDGTGFLYSTVDLYWESSNIFRFDISSKKTTQITKLNKEFARTFSISSDGQWIVYERAKEHDANKPADLWVQKMNGTA